jgi:FkbM family methyltransferase
LFRKGDTPPLYWPEEYQERWLFNMVSEAFSPRDPHYYEIPQTSVKLGDVVVDCGSAEGLFSLRVFERAKHCYLVEPSPVFQRALALTFANVVNISIIPVAIGSFVGKARFSENTIKSAIGDKGELSVTVETLDHLFFEQGIRVDFIKADLEGSEMDMLKGARQTIINSKPRIAITLYHPGQSMVEIVSFLLDGVPEYQNIIKGINGDNGYPVMGHFWVE